MRFKIQFRTQFERKCLGGAAGRYRFYLKLDVAVLFPGLYILFGTFIDDAYNLNNRLYSDIFCRGKRRRGRQHDVLRIAASIAKVEKDHFALITANAYPGTNRNAFAYVPTQI